MNAPTTANNRVGYPDDTRLLIVNADDLGMAHATNAAITRAMSGGVLTSTTVMAPCPWALHALHALREAPQFPFALRQQHVVTRLIHPDSC